MSRGRAGPGRLRHHVGATVRDRALWAPGDRVAVAVSGGADSLALLDLLEVTRRWHGGALEVVTVDHGIREGSADDAAFVWELARSRGLPCTWVSLGLRGGASEAECRDARYRALAGLSVARVALAHHRDDLAETVLLHLLRGTGPRGFAGMAWRRDRYVRPLLDVPRADLRRWLAWRGLAWRDDPTNTDPGRLRNRLRHEVLPLLEDVRPGGVAAIARGALRTSEELSAQAPATSGDTLRVDVSDPGV